jgi:RNase H-fold protein (predicted Holliday junction resolvase)
VNELSLRRRILGIDLGRARIGVAVSDELGMLAHPVETILAGPGATGRIAEIVREKNADRALRESGQKTRNSRSFIDQIAAQMILQGYLDGLQAARGLDTGSEPDAAQRD